jgi:hypothetical protein
MYSTDLALHQRLQVTPDVPHISTTLGAAHDVDGRSHRSYRLVADHLTCNVLIHGGKGYVEFGMFVMVSLLPSVMV